MKIKSVGFRVLMSFYISIDDVWQNTTFSPHWNYKIYSTLGTANNAIKDMQNSGQYLSEEKFKTEEVFTAVLSNDIDINLT